MGVWKLKEYVTVPEVAGILSKELNADISEADLYQLALEEKIKLSVKFVNTAYAKIGKFIPYGDVIFESVPGLYGKGFIKMPTPYGIILEKDINLETGVVSDTPYLTFSDEIVKISGVWDLPMCGAEKGEINKYLQNATNGPEVTDTYIDGIYLTSENRLWVKLLDSGGDHHPTDRLDGICKIVARTSEIQAFITRMQAPARATEASEKPLAQKERDTLLTIIGLLCIEAKIDHEKNTKSADYLSSQADLAGVSISKRAIQEHLGRVADAMGKRK